MTDVEFITNTFFNVREVPVYRQRISNDEERRIITEPIEKYKLLIKDDTDENISVVKQGYKVIENREVIEPILEYLDKTDVRWTVDKRNSYSGIDKMRLKIVYPDLNIEDDSDQGLQLGHGIYNSFNGSGSMRILEYILRLVCTNGLTSWQSSQNRLWFRHTNGFTIENYKRMLDNLISNAPTIGNRVRALREVEINSELLEKAIGLSTKGMSDYIEQETSDINRLTQWRLLNIMTYYVSHFMKQRTMSEYQYKIGRLFAI